MTMPVFADIEAAAQRIAPYVVRTPLVENFDLNARLRARVLLKLENLQRTGSFKMRGATNRILQIPQNKRGEGVIAFSSGNHAQGVAAAAAALGMHATIVMPADAPKAKLDNTRALGAEIVFYDRLRDDREAIAARLLKEKGGTLVKPFDDPAVVAGQGTAGLEMSEDAKVRGAALTHVLVPCSGGGLASGVALAVTHAFPACSVYSVEPEGFDGMRRSLAQGRRATAPGGAPSMADALMAPTPGETPFALAQAHLAAGLTVSDADLARAVSYGVRRLKLVIEPGGAAALAALLAGKLDIAGKTVGVVISGGNADPDTLARCCAAFSDP